MTEVWFKGRQWSVTEYGLESERPGYAIPKERLLEFLPDHSWLIQVVPKVWVDQDDFIAVFALALTMHGKPLPAEVFREHVLIARDYRARNDAAPTIDTYLARSAAR